MSIGQVNLVIMLSYLNSFGFNPFGSIIGCYNDIPSLREMLSHDMLLLGAYHYGEIKF